MDDEFHNQLPCTVVPGKYFMDNFFYRDLNDGRILYFGLLWI